jgi:hypothetical protein
LVEVDTTAAGASSTAGMTMELVVSGHEKIPVGGQ